MEMGNWNSEILHLKCPAGLSVSFDSPDLVEDVRFCGTLIAFSLVVDFSPLIYKADSTACIVHRQDMENTVSISLSNITQEPCGCSTDRTHFSRQHHTDPTTTILSTVFSRLLLHLLWTFPPNVCNRERWMTCKLCFTLPADALKTSVLLIIQSGFFFWRIEWFPSLLCARVSLLEKSWEGVDTCSSLSLTCIL